MTDILPIKEHKTQILYAIDKHDITIITAQTGSGKTTQIPQFLIQAGYIIDNQKIGIILPRRIAATSLSKRVAQQLGCYNGEIACNVRFHSTVNQNSRVVFLTDGMLVQQLYSDPLLQQYSVIVLDDIHQRSINFQILFGFVKKIFHSKRIKPLKVIITSATLESQKLIAFFSKQSNYKNTAEKQLKISNINITGRLHEVAIRYLEAPTKNYFLKAFQTLIYIDRERGQGDVLVFLPSVQEIEGMYHMLDSYAMENKNKIQVLMLHAGLSLEQQSKIFDHSYDRKIILSTNISESSITIPGIKFVVDCGYVKIKVYDSQSGVQKMITVPCGKSGANQRAGRAGRIQNGQCFRMYTQDAFRKMLEKVPPQIMRVSLANFLLKLKGLGITDILNFQLLEKPQQYNLIKAIDTLSAYNLIDQSFQLTQKGRIVSQFSLDIRNASMLIDSFDLRFGCSKEIIILVSMLQIERQLWTSQGLSVLKTKKKVGSKQGDFTTLINIFLKFSHTKQAEKKKICKQLKLSFFALQRAVRIHDQILAQIKKINRYKNEWQYMQSKFGNSQTPLKNYDIKSSSDDYQPILRCILMGFFTNVAQLQGDGTYLNIRSKQKLQIHPTSVLSVVYPQWIVYLQIVKSSGYYIYNGSQIDVEWLFQLAGHYYQDLRKGQANSKFTKEKEHNEEIEPYIPIQVEEKPVATVGKTKIKRQFFNTSVLGLKKMNKSTLSFEQQDI